MSHIPIGKIIARPRADGGWSLSEYMGEMMGWVSRGQVSPDDDPHKAMLNLMRPVLSLEPGSVPDMPNIPPPLHTHESHKDFDSDGATGGES